MKETAARLHRGAQAYRQPLEGPNSRRGPQDHCRPATGGIKAVLLFGQLPCPLDSKRVLQRLQDSYIS